MSTKNTPEVGTEQLLATGDQVDHVEGLVEKRLRGLSRDQIQLLITNGGVYIQVYNRMLDEVLSRLTGMIIRRIKPDRTRTPQQVIAATARRQPVNDDVLVTMPMGEGNGEVEMIFFKPGRRLTPAELDAEYVARDLEPDPVAQAAINEADPAFADECPNGTQWKLPGGGWGFLFFSRGFGGRYVYVVRNDDDWHGNWSFGGVRKKKALGF